MTARPPCRAPSARPRLPSGTVRAVTAQPLPLLDPAFADTRQSRAIANALCTPLVRYADAQGLPGTVLVPGLARDLPVVSRGSRTFRVQLLSGLKFADGRTLTTLDVRATFERLLDPATHSPGAALFSDLLGSEAFAAGSAPASAWGAGQSGTGDVHAQTLGSGLPRAPRDAARVHRPEWHAPPCGARPAGTRRDRSLPRTRALLRGDRPAARDNEDPGAERRDSRCRGTHLDHAAARCGGAADGDRLGIRRRLAR